MLEIESAVESRKAELDTGRIDAVLVEPRLGLYAIASGSANPSGGQPSSRLFLNALLGQVATLAQISTDRNEGWARTRSAFEEVFEIASRTIRDEFGEDARTDTSATVLLVRGPEAAVAHLGATRAYCLRSGKVLRLTHDHREQAEDFEDRTFVPVKSKAPSGQALGQGAPLKIDGVTFRLVPGTVIALISEGVSGIVRGDQLLGLSREYGTLARLASATVTCAARRQVVADSTAVVVGVKGSAVVQEAPPRQPPVRKSEPRSAPQSAGLDARAWVRRGDTLAHALTLQLFQGLTADQVQKAMRAGIAVTLRPGELLFAAGSAANKLYVIQSGQIAEEEGDRIWETGQILGEHALLDTSAYPNTVRASADTRLLAFRRDRLEGLMKSDPGLAAQIYRNAARCLVD